jgi:hypothetical protein
MALPKKAKKKAVFRGTKASDIGNYKAPDWSELTLDNPKYANAYHWALNYAGVILDKAVLKKEVIKYLDPNKTDTAALKVLPDWEFFAIGKQCWIANNGAELDAHSMTRISNLSAKLVEKGKIAVKTKKKVEKKEAKVYKPNIQERIREQVSELIAGLEVEVDAFVENDYKSEFKAYDYLQKNQVKAMQAGKIAAFYEPLLVELVEVKGKKDDDLNEAFSFIKPRELTRYIKFIQDLVDDANMMVKSAKVARKPKKAKVKTTGSLVKDLKYQVEDKNYKLVSVNPEKIIGASELWIFNTKYKSISKFVALDRGGLTVKGSTLKNWDEKQSEHKAVRKPDEVLPKALTGGKIVRRKLIPDLTTKPGKPNGRINKDTIILRVEK